MTFTPSLLAGRPLAGVAASALALGLSLLWHPAWLAPLLVVLLTVVWIVETCHRAEPAAEPVPAIHAGPVREALEIGRADV